MGECLNDLRFDELQSLEKEMESAVKIIRNQKVNIYYIICLNCLVSNYLIYRSLLFLSFNCFLLKR